MKQKFFSLLLLLCLGLSSLPLLHAQAASGQPVVVVLRAEGALTPVMVEYLKRGLNTASERQAQALVLQLNTPGGSIDLMNQMVQLIRESPVPVVVYIAPRGSIAGSAGTLITLAGQVAAMAPETSIGAASPVGSQGEDMGTTMETKVKEILKAEVRSLAEWRGAAASRLAEEMIENARAVSSSEALKANLIDLVADDMPNLLAQLQGREVDLKGQKITLNTQNALLVEVPLTFIEQFLQLMTNPNLVFLLLSVGVQAILIELSSPGGWVAGFIGAICLLLSIYGMGVLPVNWFGALFLVLAFVLFILDIKAPTHGALTIAGTGSFLVGALVLFNSPQVPPVQRVSVPLVVGMSLFLGVSFFTILTIALRAQKIPVKIGQATLVGRTGTVRSEINPNGTVQISSELWSAELAEGEAPIPRGAHIEVIRVEGMRLIVRKSIHNE